jgi:hypothetical protein
MADSGSRWELGWDTSIILLKVLLCCRVMKMKESTVLLLIARTLKEAMKSGVEGTGDQIKQQTPSLNVFKLIL